MPVTTTITAILREYMYENKLNTEQFPQILEVPNSTLSELMNRKKKPNLSIAKKLHEKLHIDGNFLLETA